MTKAQPPDSSQIYGVWADSRDQIVSYSYLGCSSVLHDGFAATGRMPLRSDMRSGGSLLCAPVAIAMLDAAGNAIDRHWQLALTHVAVNLVGGARDIATLGVQSSMTRAARSQIFTEAGFIDADNPDKVVGFGTADWAVISPAATGFDYIDPGTGLDETGDLPPLSEVYGAFGVKGGFVIEEITPRLGGPMLHHGPILVTLEAAALAVVDTDPAGADVESFDVRLVRAAKRGPLRATARVLTEAGGATLVRADLRQDFDDRDLIATATVRLRQAP